MNREWKVLRNGGLWSDRFNSEDLAYEHIKECVEDDGYGDYNDYEVKEMTKEEIMEYYANDIGIFTETRKVNKWKIY